MFELHIGDYVERSEDFDLLVKLAKGQKEQFAIYQIFQSKMNEFAVKPQTRFIKYKHLSYKEVEQVDEMLRRGNTKLMATKRFHCDKAILNRSLNKFENSKCEKDYLDLIADMNNKMNTQ